MNCQRKFIINCLLITFLTICINANLDISEISQSRSEFTKKILHKLDLNKKPTKHSKDLIKKSVTKIMLQSFNDAADEMIGFIPEVPPYNFTEDDRKPYHIFYNVSGSTIDMNRLYSSEFRFYKHSIINDDNNYTVSVYRNILDAENEWQSYLLDARNVSGDYEGWIIMNVTETLKSWLGNEINNYGLHMTAELQSNALAIEVEDIGIAGIDGEGEEPFVLGFFYTLESPREHRQIRHARHVSKAKFRAHCNVHDWYVTFESIAFDNIIIAPEGYWANYCAGKCPLFDDVNFHSMIQTRAAILSSDEIPSVNCSPIEFSSTDMLYYHDDNKIIKKMVKDMTVTKCECR